MLRYYLSCRIDVLVVSPTWTTYRPQSLLAHHAPYVVEASMETEWRVTPEAVEKVTVSTVDIRNITTQNVLSLSAQI